MASGGSERLYEEDDRLDERLLNQISKWIMYNRLPSLARHLGFSDAEISRIMIYYRTPEEHCFQILKRWNDRNTLTVKDVVESMVQWQHERCLDPGIWNHLRPRMQPRLIPAPSVLHLRPPAKRKLENIDLGDSDTPHIVEIMSDEENSKIHTSRDGVLPKSVHEEQENGSKFSGESCSVNSGNGHAQIFIPTPEETKDLQFRLKDSLERTWKNSLSHDWIPVKKAKTFPLRDFYVGLRWVRVVKRAIQNFNKELTSIFDILEVADPSERPKPTNILVTAGPGMGKTCSMAKLALDWEPGSSDKSNPMTKFDFVFLLRLRYADKKSSLAELIVAQHEKLEHDDIKHIRAILNGKTGHSVLLILDGYDEYKPGNNKEIDRAIESSIGNCFLILTSRPDLPSKEGQYVSKEIRDRMDGEVVVEGFTEESIKQCSTQYLESEEKSKVMLKQAVDTGIYVLLKVPIVLLMVCVLFCEQNSLPQTRTKIVRQIFQLTVERTTLKLFDLDMMEFLNDLLLSLGELSWNALQSDVQQLLLRKDEIKNKSPLLLTLGLLFEIGIDTASPRKQPGHLSFHHKIFQEYSGAYFASQKIKTSRNVKETLQNLFPSMYEVKRLEEVLLFTVGLMDDPTALVDHVYELEIDRILDMIRYGQVDDENEQKLIRLGKSVNDMSFFQSLYKESKITLSGTAFHNQHMNFYTEGDISPIYLPSRLFQFHNMEKDVERFAILRNGKENAAGEVSDSIFLCVSEGATNILCKQIRRISQLQPISDICICEIKCKDLKNTDVFNMSNKTRSINMWNCVLPAATLDHLLQQISNSSSISRITFQATSLCDINSLWFQYLPSLSTLYLWNTNLCRFHILHLAHLMENRKLPHIKEISFGGNNLNPLKDHLDSFLTVVSKHHKRNVMLEIQQSNLPRALMQKWRELAKQPKLHYLVGDEYHPDVANEDNQIPSDESEDEEPSRYISLEKSIYENTQLGLTNKLRQNVSLADFHIPHHFCGPILQAMSSHKNISSLDLSGNILRIHGLHLVNTIMTWGPEPVLQELDLSHCSLPVEVCRPLLSVLGRCKHMVELWLPGNALTGCAKNFLTHPNSRLPFLEELFLSYTELIEEDLLHLTQLFKTGKLPQMKELDLGANRLHRMEKTVYELVQSLVKHHKSELKLNLYFNRLPNDFVRKIKLLCQNADIVLQFG